MKPEGDRHISGLDNKHWEMTYHILMKYGVPVRFKYQLGDVRCHCDSMLTWFIPEDATNYKEIEQFIMNELERDVENGKEADLGDGEKIYLMGLKVYIYPFSGPFGYSEREEIEKMAPMFIEYLTEHFKNMSKKAEEELKKAPKSIKDSMKSFSDFMKRKKREEDSDE